MAEAGGLAPHATRWWHDPVSNGSRRAGPFRLPWSFWQDPHLQLSGFKPDASANWATGEGMVSVVVAAKEKVSPEGIAPPAFRLEAGCSSAELQGQNGWQRRTCTQCLGCGRHPVRFGLLAIVVFANGPCGRNCTRTGAVLSGVSLLLDYAGEKDETGAPGRTFACNLRVRSAALSTLSYGSLTWKTAGVMLPILAVQSSRHHFNACGPW